MSNTQDREWIEGVKKYMDDKDGDLHSQIGNPEGEDKPNKKFYDPRAWLRKGEESFVARLKEAFGDLNCLNQNA